MEEITDCDELGETPIFGQTLEAGVLFLVLLFVERLALGVEISVCFEIIDQLILFFFLYRLRIPHYHPLVFYPMLAVNSLKLPLIQHFDRVFGYQHFRVQYACVDLFFE